MLPDGSVLRSTLSRESSPLVSADALRALVAGNNAFALDLYHQLAKDTKDNLFYSPASISRALAMTFAGAGGDTEHQMASALHFDLAQTQLHPAFNALDLALASRGQGAQGKEGQGFALNLVNALWGQRGYNFLSTYLDALAVNYDAGLTVLDFLEQTEPSRKIINEWVAKNTGDRIPELLKQGDVLPSTRLVLTNAVYFNAAWDEVFPAENTAPGPFTRLDGSTVTAQMMSHADTYGHATGNGWEAVELLYDGQELSMVVIVPEAGRFDEIEGQLDAEWLDGAISTLSSQTLSLTLPKWKFSASVRLKDSLEALGMPIAFTPKADFSAINGGVEPLWIGNVIHEAFIAVDEKGTEATAATAVVMLGGGMPRELRVDRPFIFVIRDRPTGSMLFVGRVTNP